MDSTQPTGQTEVASAATTFGAATPTFSRRDASAPLAHAVDVSVDRTGHLGLLTYLVPDDMVVRSGDAVAVPFGKSTRHGMVVGPASAPEKANKTIACVFGTRADPSDVTLARNLAKYHFADPATVVTRLSPTSGRGATPIDDPTIELHPDVTVSIPAPSALRRMLVVDPNISPAHVAAAEAARLADSSPGGQVLVVCPTAEMVTDVLASFTTGAQRLDSKAPRGAWKGFVEGTVRIGVGTRTAALYSAAQLCAIVVVEPQHVGHRELRQPKTHARDVCSARARARRLAFSLVSTAPGPCDVWAVNSSVDRIEGQWPKFVIADRHAAKASGDEVLIPPAMRSALRAAARRNITPLVVASRNTAARRCVACSALIACTETECDGGGACRHQQTEPCPTCERSAGVRITGWDTPRLQALLGKNVTVVSATQLPNYRDAGLVVVFDFDVVVNSTGWFPHVHGARLLVLAAQAAGPAGTVVVATNNVKEPVIRDIVARADVVAVAKRAATTAKAQQLPPFARMVTVTVTRKSAPDVSGWPGRVAGPTRVGDQWQILVSISNEQLLTLTSHIASIRKRSKTTVWVQ